jgi:ubiquitin thioesterase protein OTUB1
MEVLSQVGKPASPEGDERAAELHRVFNDQGLSDYVVVYLRLITSGQLQRESAFYEHFIEGDRSISDFCHQVSFYFFPFPDKSNNNLLNFLGNKI